MRSQNTGMHENAVYKGYISGYNLETCTTNQDSCMHRIMRLWNSVDFLTTT